MNQLGENTVPGGSTGVTLIVPLGVEPPIFPWGVMLVADHVRAARVTDVEVIDLARHPAVRQLVDDNMPLFAELRRKLAPAGAKTFPSGGPALSGYNDTFVGVLLCLGRKFIDVAVEQHMYPSIRSRSWLDATRVRLDELKREHEQVLSQILLSSPRADDHTLFGITTYDHTVFYVLALARMIKDRSPSAPVILGGDFWDFRTAREAVSKLPWLDGVCVGYGENVIVEILDVMARGGAPRDALIKGFINRSVIEKESHIADLFVKPKHLVGKNGARKTYQTFNVPQPYFDATAADYQLVHDHPDDPRGREFHSNTKFLRVLTKRGCSYSACRFCTQIDRFLNFPFAIEDTVAQLEARFAKVSPDAPVSVLIDNDELDIDELLRLIDVFEAHPDKWTRVLFWFQVKRFEPAVAEAVTAARAPNKYFFVMNWETLNPLTLKHMAKGHSVLGGIAAAKAILDAGADWMSNMMGIFPGQTLDSVAQEVRFINAAMPLIANATAFSFFPYYANSRDQISGNPENYHIITKQDHNIWPKIAFGVDLALSLFEWQWTDSRDGPEGDLARAWHDLLLGKRSLMQTTGLILYHSVRARDFAYFRRLRALRLKSRGKGALAVGRGKTPVLALHGDHLRIRGQGWLAREKRIRLSDTEIALLREAYFVRKTSEIKQFLAEQHGLMDHQIDALLKRHLALGTIVTHKTRLVSAVRDPEYLKQRRANVSVPVARPQGPWLVKLASLVRQASI